MNQTIDRQSSAVTVTILNGAALSDVIDMTRFVGGVIDFPASWTAASLGFKHSADRNGTFTPVYDETGTLLSVSAAASKSFFMPDKLFGCRYIKLWSETAGADVNQGADRSIIVSLKG